MKWSVLSLLVVCTIVEAASIPKLVELRHTPSIRRGTAPTTSGKTYAPYSVSCPSNSLVRQTADAPSIALSTEEQAWVTARRANIVSTKAWSSYLNNPALGLAGFDIPGFLANTSNLPNVGLAFSGGGYRAMLHGAGLFNAFDSRNSSSVAQGTGGVIQLATYLAGLSGGSWFVGSVAINDFPTTFELRDIWNLTQNLVSTASWRQSNHALALADGITGRLSPKASSEMWSTTLIS